MTAVIGSGEREMIVDLARKVGERFGLDYWYRQDRLGEFPREAWAEICRAGLCGVALPEEYGGAGLGMVEMALIVEELAAGGAGATVGQLFMINPIFGGVAVSRYGSEGQRRAILPGLITGDVICCMALTEPDAGTNTLDMRTTARADAGGWRLRGNKIWITAVPDATKMLVVARTKAPDEVTSRADGISLFLIDVDRDGLSHDAIEKVGTHTLAASNVYFDDVPVRRDELVGTLHGGWRELLDVLNTERIVTTAALVGAGRLAERLAVDYAKERRVFGGTPIAAYQGLQFPLAQAHAERACARQMNLRAAELYDAGQPYGTEANLAKLVAAQAASATIDRAMQTMGGMGFARESHVERLWRDARLFKFAPVSEEMILNYIAVHCLGMPRSY
ncbi:MAG TPA: acyl-CoA dehydrogenase family protein [Acidimicrobiia bacterium]|nr:acyl-CoA dehydrogenase family protein [Acidimicrobiia bacterium]